MLSNLAVCAELFHTADGTAFADLTIDGHRETWPVRSIRLRSWLRRKHYEATGAAATAGAISSALDLLEARAQFDAPQRAVYLRVAEHDGRIYLDLADERWRAVEIGPDGWQVITRPPVRFRRAAGMLPLPMPIPGGSLEALAPFFNVANRGDFVLVMAWLLAALRHGGPYPLLAVSGEQGSAKTVFSKILRGLIDPNAAPVRTGPREERDLFIAASNGHLLAFDNLSDLPPWMSDALCRLASGGSFAVRQLYTDRDEVLFQAARPIILNGIEDVITRPDLADRAIFLSLTAPPGRTSARRERDLARFRDGTAAHPRGVVGCCKPWIACPTRGSTGTAATDGRLCTLGNGLRTGILPRWRLFACLQGKPPVRCRGCGRGRPGSGSHPRHHGRADHVERECFRPFASRCLPPRDDASRTGVRMAKIPPSACRPAPARADAPSSAGNRNDLWS